MGSCNMLVLGSCLVHHLPTYAFSYDSNGRFWFLRRLKYPCPDHDLLIPSRNQATHFGKSLFSEKKISIYDPRPLLTINNRRNSITYSRSQLAHSCATRLAQSSRGGSRHRFCAARLALALRCGLSTAMSTTTRSLLKQFAGRAKLFRADVAVVLLTESPTASELPMSVLV